MRCDICGYDMKKKIGVAINIGGLNNKRLQSRVKKMFGRTQFSCCWCCLIKAFGFKEEVK